jgi:hypothetical protein
MAVQNKGCAKRLFIIFCLFCFGFVGIVISASFDSEKARNIPAVKAEPYVWPQGCEHKRYKFADRISPKCMDSRYFLTNKYAKSLGASTGTRRREWPSYRVGNDIIGIDEMYLHDGQHGVATIRRNKFYQ